MPEAPAVPERLEGLVRLSDEKAVRELLSRPLDFGCRPTVIRESDGGFSVPVIGSAQALERLRADGFDLRVVDPPADRRKHVGDGDRFEGGNVVPRGFGRKVVEPGKGEREG